MRLIRHLNPAPSGLPPAAIAVGNFDGLHRGHQALIGQALAGRDDGLAAALMCFEPLPATFFRPDRPMPRVQGVRDRLAQCRRLGLDLVFMLRFNASLARRSPEQFVREVLVRDAGARRIIVGADFRFGAGAAGDVDRLRELAGALDVEVRVVDAVRDGRLRVSSSAIRECLAAGDLATAEKLLGRPYTISGRVLRGQSLGRSLGFATVNLRPPAPPALSGIAAVRVSGSGLDAHPGVASLGRRPTVDGREWLLEVHLFDYDGDLYGRHLEVAFVEFLRHEERFDDLEGMKRQMEQDAQSARNSLEAYQPGK